MSLTAFLDTRPMTATDIFGIPDTPSATVAAAFTVTLPTAAGPDVEALLFVTHTDADQLRGYLWGPLGSGLRSGFVLLPFSDLLAMDVQRIANLAPLTDRDLYTLPVGAGECFDRITA